MASVVVQGCTKCKKCLSVCPVEAFHESCDMLIIHPKTCIDCGACIPACPAQAIYAQEDLPKPLRRFKRLNAKNAIQCPLAKE